MQPLDRLKAINDLKESKTLDSKRHSDMQMAHLKTQETILEVFRSFADYLDKRISKTEVVNQLKSIDTPDALKVAAAVDDLHSTIKTHENTDLSEVTGIMQSLLAEAKQIPKSYPEIPETKVIDYTEQFSALAKAVKAVEKVVQNQKLVAEAPIVNVPETSIDIQAPDFKPLEKGHRDIVKAVQAIIIPETNLDTSPVEKLLKKTNKLLDGILEKPVGGRGGGSSRATPYQDSNGTPAFVELIAGKVPVDAEISIPPITVDPPFKLDPSAPLESGKYAHVDAQGDLQVDIVSSALPTGAATAAKQLPDNHNVIVTSAPTTAVTGTFFQATQPVSIAATVATKEIQPTAEASTNVTNSTSNQTALAINANRRMATFFNDDTLVTGAFVYLKCGAVASATSFKIKIAPGGYYELPQPVYSGVIDVLATAATGTLRVCETT